MRMHNIRSIIPAHNKKKKKKTMIISLDSLFSRYLFQSPHKWICSSCTEREKMYTLHWMPLSRWLLFLVFFVWRLILNTDNNNRKSAHASNPTTPFHPPIFPSSIIILRAAAVLSSSSLWLYICLDLIRCKRICYAPLRINLNCGTQKSY